MPQIKIKITSTRPNLDIKFYKNVDIMNYMLDNYIFPEKMVATSFTSEDGLIETTILSFPSEELLVECLQKDPTVKKHSQDRFLYNQSHNIDSVSEIIYG